MVRVASVFSVSVIKFHCVNSHVCLVFQFQAVRQVSSGSRFRQPLEDCDPNSQDSGYCYSDDSKSTSSDFPFAQPSGLAPRRSTTDSPRRSLHSPSSTESNDDGFIDFILPVSFYLFLLDFKFIYLYAVKFHYLKAELYIRYMCSYQKGWVTYATKILRPFLHQSKILIFGI